MTNRIEIESVLLNGQPLVVEVDDYGPYCFVCRRCTDHVGEHDDLVDAGLADYEDGGYVVRTVAA